MLRALFLLIRFRSVTRLLWRLTMDRRVPLGLKMLLPAALAYIVLPFDLVPDFLPILGRIDDLLALLLAVVLFIALAPREVVAEHLTGSGSQQSGPRPNDRPVIDGKYRISDDD